MDWMPLFPPKCLKIQLSRAISKGRVATLHQSSVGWYPPHSRWPRHPSAQQKSNQHAPNQHQGCLSSVPAVKAKRFQFFRT
eukprot:1137810-Pelagomonas_calceolata.AAC.2